MVLYDEEEVRIEKEKTRKRKRLIIAGIILTLILIIALIVAIAYLIYNPNKITVVLNGTTTQRLDSVLDITKTEDGSIKIHAPIRRMAAILEGYESGDGGKENNINDKNYCYIESANELVVFTLDSNIISRENKTSKEYENIEIENPIIAKDEELYTDLEGLQKAFNLTISFEEETKKLFIVELPQLVNNAKTIAEKAGYENISEEFINTKSILDGVIVVEKNQNYGLITYDNNPEELLTPQCTSMTYIPSKQKFKVSIDGKIGITAIDGKQIISPNFMELTMIDNENEIYLAKSMRRFYGAIDQYGNTLIHPEYNKIGIDSTNFQENEIKNPYILSDQLIPVQKENKWGFYKLQKTNTAEGTQTLQCNKIVEYIFDDIGCRPSTQGNLIANLAVIEDYGIVVVEQNDKYGLMDIDGKIVGDISLAEIYMETSEGNFTYYMVTQNGKKLNVIDELEKRGYKKIK